MNAVIRSPAGGRGRGASTTWLPTDSIVRMTASTATTHAGSTWIPSTGGSTSTPILRPTGGPCVRALTRDRLRGGGDHHAAGSWRASTSRAAAWSVTERVSPPSVAKPWPSTLALVTRPRVGLSPTRPLHDAGTRIDPPSAACAIGAIPAATDTPAPLDDPPGVRSGSH